MRAHIAELAVRHGRAAGSVQLLAVGKRHPPEALAALAAAGQRHFGENYLQEALVKQAALADGAGELHWHYIGRLQSNKTRAVAECFDWVHTLDRLRLAERLSDQRPGDRPPLNICLQVNQGERGKGGVAPGALPELAAAIAELPGLRLRGLMTLPDPAADLAAQRQPFAALRRMLEHLRSCGLALDTLSMGMSGDLEAAIAEWATWVRLGTALFGPRPAT